MLLISALLALSAAPALADEPKKAAAPEKRICRDMGVTGTIMSSKICRTRAEWAAADAEHERKAGLARNDPRIEHQQGAGNLIPN